jgi:hypothetical protein
MKNYLSKAHPSSLMNNGSERQKGASLPLLTAMYSLFVILLDRVFSLPLLTVC